MPKMAETPNISRRNLLKSAAVGGASLSLGVVSLLPTAKQASATNEDYQIDWGCYRNDNPENEWNCEVGCGPSIATLSGVCAWEYHGDWGDWHKDEVDGNIEYQLRPDQCIGSTSHEGSWDGWLWSEACDGQTKLYRCYDGTKTVGNNATLRTICSYVTW